VLKSMEEEGLITAKGKTMCIYGATGTEDNL